MMSWMILIVTFIISCLAIAKVYLKLTCGICKSSAHLVGKVAIVTGANTGIGYETAKDFAERGARVILACRNESLAVAASKRIEADTGSKDVHYRHLDLSSLQSVREFAKTTLETEKRLDILVNNAGAFNLENKKTEDGLLLGMQTNHFGPFLLTNLLMPLLKSSAPSRIINVSSLYHIYGDIDVDDLNFDRVPKDEINDQQVYNNSKLCNVLFTAELSRRLEGTRVTANSVHPGAVATEIMRNNTSVVVKFLLNRVIWKFVKTPREGAQTQIYLAVSADLNNVSGKYFSDCKEKKASIMSKDPDLPRKLWDKSEELVDLMSVYI